MTSILQIGIAFFIGLLVVYYSIPVIVRISVAKNLHDVPNERKVNKTIIPNLGGISLFIGIVLGTGLGIFKSSFPDLRYILSAMVILFFIGMKDDILVIAPLKKLAAQILCAIILVFLGDIRFTHFHGILGINEINYTISVFFSALAIVGIINAMNLIDGIDGLSASVGIMASVIFGILFFEANQINYSILCFATTGSLISFFVYNVYGKTNKIFMGDTGALILGLILSVCAIAYIESTIGKNEIMFKLSPILSLAILAIPLFDMIRLFFMRIFHGKSPFSPDKNHIHHKFLKLGLTHLKSTMIIVFSNLLIIGIIVYFREENNHMLLLALVILILTLILLPEAIYEIIKSQNSKAKRIQIQYYNSLKKMDLKHKQKFTSYNDIVNLKFPLEDEQKHEITFNEN